jgi:type II restriction/modification system DNA methylase subunit YeeA
VWKRAFFGWEYKGKHKDLDAAYDQLLLYREALENPPLLVVCDMDRFVIHTNFTATANKTYEITLNDLDSPRSIEILRYVFHEPEKLRPSATSDAITREVAERLAGVAEALRGRGFNPTDVARFLDRIVFCLFAEDVGLLPKKLFSEIAESAQSPKQFADLIGQLFTAMADGGYVFIHPIRHFNGNLFVESPVLELTSAEIKHVQAAARLDWSAVDPSIFGTLFQRGLDPDTRAQLGAQYTSREDIETLIEPVVMNPLRREWRETRRAIENLLQTGKVNPTGKERPLTKDGANKAYREARARLRNFHERLAHVKVLDPACGSGNFLYVTLQKLKDLEKEVLVYANDTQLGSFLPQVGPWQFYGIEINPYAFELAQTTLWIGYLQWIQANGFGVPAEPILREMNNFSNMDAVLDLTDPNNPHEPEWPEVDFIVGNPPFLGDKVMKRELGNTYVDALRDLFRDRIPGQADLCCYWFEKARDLIERGKCKRAGLLATQNIRGGASRHVLDEIKKSGDIFFAVSDREWILAGAMVHISMVGFDDGSEAVKILDGNRVDEIHPNLSSDTNVTKAAALTVNSGIGFIGSCKGGPFDIDENEAISLLNATGNPHGLPNSDLVRPLVNSKDLMTQRRQRWIIDTSDMSLEKASQYAAPFSVIAKRVEPVRSKNSDRWLKENWWRPQRMRSEMRAAVAPLSRFIVTPTTSKHRVFVWLSDPVLPDHKLVVIARDDSGFFGVLQSRIHEVWARSIGTQLRERESGLNYNVNTSFETFPFPERLDMITTAANELDDVRSRWLNPPEMMHKETLEFPGSVNGPWSRFLIEPNSSEIGMVRYARLVPNDEEAAKELAKRTLTNLYNERPTWLDLAHKKLDQSVFEAYGWESTSSDEVILSRLLKLNQERVENAA